MAKKVNAARKSVFSTLGYTVNSVETYESRFEVVKESMMKFSASEAKNITKCCLRAVNSDYKNGQVLKLHVTAKLSNGKYSVIWVKLDSVSYKRYCEEVNANIDPTMVVFYQRHDPQEEYGKEENDFCWWEVRIKEGAIVDSPCTTLDDDEFPF